MEFDWDVVIVGCGPVGAYAANQLGQHGLRTLVVDRDVVPYDLPRAVHIDHEMVRLLADVGLRDAMMPLMRAGDGHIHIGADGGVIRYLSVRDDKPPFGYANDYFFYQPELESVLREGLGRYPHVTLQTGRHVDALEPTTEGVTVRFADGNSARAKWVLGCDGARSTVRKAAGIKLRDMGFEEPWLVVDAEVDGPIHFPPFWGVPEGANLQNLSLMMCDPNRPATIVPGRERHRRWEFMLLPHETEAEITRPEKIVELLAPWVGDEGHRVIRAATYRFHGLVAEHWQSGRVFLLGDSAHQTPPFFGQGMCHGLRDAANLGWKLGLVARGVADAKLLDTYQVEREPQVRHVINAAIDAGRYICELDPDKAVQRDATLRNRKSIRSAAELIAPISSRIVIGKAGQRFINPQIEEGKLLDDISGGGWTLIATSSIEPTREAAAVMERLNVRPLVIGVNLNDQSAHLKDWMKSNDAVAVLVRPDFYVATVAGSPAELSASLVALGQAMTLDLPVSRFAQMSE